MAEEGADVVGWALEGVGDGFVAAGGMVYVVYDTHLEGPRRSVSWGNEAMKTEGSETTVRGLHLRLLQR